MPTVGIIAASLDAGRRRSAGLALVAVCFFVGGCAGLVPGTGSDRIDGTGRDASFSAEAITTLRRQMTEDATEPYWPHRLGEIYVSVDSLGAAAEALGQALARDPGYAPSVVLMSQVQFRLGLHEEAVKLLSDHIAAHPAAPSAAHAALAIHLEALGDIDRAESELAACTAELPEIATARTYFELRGDAYVDALDLARRTLNENPESAANHNNYGIALLYAGQPQAARQAFQDALAIAPELAGALYNMAIVSAVYEFDEEAGRRWLARYRQVADDDPDDLNSILEKDLTTASAPAAAGVEATSTGAR